jgi:hypothetical protein
MGAVHVTGLDHLSPSGAATLVQCERQFFYRYAYGVGRNERSEPLAMGGGLAAALEHRDLSVGLAEYFDRRPVVDAWTDPDADKRATWIACGTIENAYDGYLARWPDENVEREVTHFVRLAGTRRMLQVRIDGVAPGHLIEDKLRSGSSLRADAIEAEVHMGRQLSAEIYGHWKATGEIVPVHLRCIKKADPRKLKKCETREQVDEVLGEHFASDGVFNEFVATRTVDQLKEFESEFVALARRADELLQSGTPTGVRNDKACHAFGRECPALSVCKGLRPWQDLVQEQGR